MRDSGPVSQREAERWLASRIERIRLAREGGTRPRVTFREAAAKYLRDYQEQVATIDVAAWHIETLDPGSAIGRWKKCTTRRCVPSRRIVSRWTG